jgi:NitT/TauT family transport system permease protein
MSSPDHTLGGRAYRRRVLLTRTSLIVLVLALLEAVPRSGLVDPLTLVPLSTMAEQLVTMLGSGVLTPHLVATGSMVLAAFVLACGSGMLGGYLLWRSPRTFRVLDPYLTSYYAMPFFAFYPVLVAIFGLSRTPIVLIAWAWAVVAVVVGTVGGLRKIPVVYHKVASVYRLSRWQTFRRVYVPAAAPLVFNGIKLALSYSIIGVIASEFILAPNGLGWLVSYDYENFAVAQMYAVILLIVLATIVLTSAIGAVQRRMQRLS